MSASGPRPTRCSPGVSADSADLIIDLNGVSFISMATLDALLAGRDILRRQSRNLTLRSPSRCAKRLLEVCGLIGLVEPGAPTLPRRQGETWTSGGG
ncbi:MAG: STAS domain-containing protein [Actinobacteria bacterium]|nr:STAS domain-containing protein [Actinomycetota bacterium]